MDTPTLQDYQAAAEASGQCRATRKDAGTIRDYWVAHWKEDTDKESTKCQTAS